MVLSRTGRPLFEKWRRMGGGQGGEVTVGVEGSYEEGMSEVGKWRKKSREEE
jgi:hypothetical protein